MKSAIENAEDFIKNYASIDDMDRLLAGHEASFIALCFCEAVSAKNRSLCEDFLLKGADPTSVSEFGDNAISSSVKIGDYELVTLFLDWGVDVNHTLHGETLLYKAVCKNNLHIIKLLLERGADQNLRAHKDVASPLYVTACASDHAGRVHVAVRACQLLLQYEPDFTWKKNTLAIQVLCEKGRFWWAKMIIEDCGLSMKSVKKYTNSYKVTSPLDCALQFQDTEFASYLIAKGAPLRESGATVLKTVLASGRAEMFDFLVSNNGLPTAGDPDYESLGRSIHALMTTTNKTANSIMACDWAIPDPGLISRLNDWFDIDLAVP